MQTTNIVTTKKKIKGIDDIPAQQSTIVSSSFEKLRLRVALFSELIKLSIKHTKNPIQAFKVIKTLKEKYELVFGEKLLTKVSKVDGKYYWKLTTPGFPSKATTLSRENEINRVKPFKAQKGLGLLLFGITKKCPLSCEHCYEWDRMHAKDVLSKEDIIEIVHKYQDYGTTQIIFGGGEPMSRFNDLCEILSQVKEGTDFWIVTSGWGLTAQKARRLKECGLTGVMISLDHHLAEQHNAFRGHPDSYNWAIKATLEAKKANLVTDLAICLSRTFTNESNLKAYIELGKKLGVSFIQFFEPVAVGRYKNKQVQLDDSQIKLLEDFYLTYNNSEEYKDYPIINYVGFHQRRYGCMGGGDYYFYIDTDGDAHSCPFCATKVCNTVKFSAEDTISLLQQTRGCHQFHQPS